ncbi:MAG: hypothetical protein JRD89_04900 [Deltaproteobacteria bacterium]|nr:hypothetical protein [Deltaproteobacteria bacterium]
MRTSSSDDVQRLRDVRDQLKLAKRALQEAMGHLARAEQIFPDVGE